MYTKIQCIYIHSVHRNRKDTQYIYIYIYIVTDLNSTKFNVIRKKVRYNKYLKLIMLHEPQQNYSLNVQGDKISINLTLKVKRPKSKIIWTSFIVLDNIIFTCEVFTTQTTAKLFVVWVYWLMRFQFSCCTETFWTFTATIRLHTFMSK